MDEATKERLRAAGAAKRAKVRLLKDVSPEGLQVACDYVEGERELLPTVEVGTEVAYLKWASAVQVLALMRRIPFCVKLVQQPGPNPRMVERVCFNRRFLVEVLTFATTQPHKYVSDRLAFSWQSACRPEDLSHPRCQAWRQRAGGDE